MSTPPEVTWVTRVQIFPCAGYWYVEVTDANGTADAYAGLHTLEEALKWAAEMIPHLPDPAQNYEPQLVTTERMVDFGMLRVVRVTRKDGPRWAVIFEDLTVWVGPWEGLESC